MPPFKGREISTKCRRCDVKWNEDLSNKHPKRALCLECYKEECKENDKKYKKERTLQTRMEINAPLKAAVRKPHWDKISAELKQCKKRSEWLPIIQRNLEIALNDEKIKAFINTAHITNRTKLKTDE